MSKPVKKTPSGMNRKMKPVKKALKFIDGLAWTGSVWYYRFVIRGKPYLGSTFCVSKSEAREELIKIKAKKLKESDRGLTRSKDIPTFKEAVDLWYNSRLGKRSQVYLDIAKKQLENHVIPTLGTIRCNQINYDVVELVLNDYLHSNNLQYKDKGHNIGGYNTLASWISAVLGNLVPTYLEVAPKIKLERAQKKRKPYIPIDQIETFLAEIDRTENLHVSVAVRAMLSMGLRESEALGMKWDNFNWSENTYCPDKTKGKECQWLAFDEATAGWFKKVQEENLERKSEWVIPAEDGLPHRKQFTKKAIARAGTKIGVKLSPHRLRGSYATLLAKDGASAFVIQNSLRHKDIKTSEGYIELGIEDIKKANSKLWGADKLA